jgi:uncharacterized protein YutE (UPF0331/DUF86 family)
MNALDPVLLAEKAALVEGHVREVARYLPAKPEDLRPKTPETYAVVLNVFLATQLVIDVASWACVRLGLGAPSGYAEGFARLGARGVLDSDLAARLQKAAGFRNLVAHQYHALDLARVHAAALAAEVDLRRFFASLASAAAS